jgi:hypothetical protein
VPGRSLTDVVRDHDVDEIVVALAERRGGSMPMRELLDCKVQGVRVVDMATPLRAKRWARFGSMPCLPGT